MNSKNVVALTLCLAGAITAGTVYFSMHEETRTAAKPASHDSHVAGSAGATSPRATNVGQQAGLPANGKTTLPMAQSQAPMAPVIPKDVPAGGSVVDLGANAAVAKVTVAGKTQTLTANEIGNYPKVYIEQKAKVPVALTFSKGEVDEPVLIYATDGGLINDDKAGGKAFQLDAKKTINFLFQANSDRGIYRVVVTKGSDTTVLQFWAGEEQPVASR